jgi:acylphosphatase
VTRARVRVSGRVQGVFFRDTVRNAAEREGLAGWVRNKPDGTLEAVLEGEAGSVERVVALCREGPPAAAVSRAEIFDEPEEGLGSFRIR